VLVLTRGITTCKTNQKEKYVSKATYVGSGWLKVFENGGKVLNLSIKKEAIDQLPVDKYGNVYLTAGARKEPDEKSKATHWVAVDDYRTQKAKDDLPF